MKEAKHPVGPAFDHAREKEEAWRQQQIAALTQDQAREYDRRVKDEQKKLETEKQRIEAGKPQQIKAEKDRRLHGRDDPGLRMLPNKKMKEQKAEDLAKSTVEQKANAQLERAGKEAKERLDGYLRQTERERAEQKKQEQTASRDRNEKAKNQEKKRSDDALSRAFKKAESQKQQSQERSQTQSQQEQENQRQRERK